MTQGAVACGERGSARRRSAAVVAAVAAAVVGAGLLTGASAAAAGTRGGGAARAAASGGTWGMVQQVPGLATLNRGGSAGISSVSCPSAGNCTAGGNYADSVDRSQAFVVSETNGTWGKAKEVPGTAALNTGDFGGMGPLSCPSAGNCSASGGYLARGQFQVFVVSEKNRIWGTAEKVPGLATLDKGGDETIRPLSCGSAGNCSAGGHYADSSGAQQAFVVSEKNGTWGPAKEIPGTATLNQGGQAEVTSLSCASAGTCSAGGYYTDRAGLQQAFVAGETNGTWGSAHQIPGVTVAKFGAAVTSLSCGSAGNCSAGGSYHPRSGQQAFVAQEVNGTWHPATKVPGTATLNQGGQAEVISLSCASAGNCSAGGQYRTSPQSSYQVFVVSEVHGTWGTAEQVPGSSALNPGRIAQINTVSCASAGNCSAGGYTTDGGGNSQAFVADQANGTWGTAQPVPGLASINAGGAAIGSLSCASPGNCSGGGYYSRAGQQAFVVGETSGP
jgi:cytochrome c551/c552